MPRGGDRSTQAAANGKKMGRPKNEADTNDIGLGKGFASGVLARIKELKLKNGDQKEIQSAEDYALDMLSARDAEARSFFKLLLAYRLGKPVQPVMTADTRENRPEVDFDGLAMPAGSQPEKTGKPN